MTQELPPDKSARRTIQLTPEFESWWEKNGAEAESGFPQDFPFFTFKMVAWSAWNAARVPPALATGETPRTDEAIDGMGKLSFPQVAILCRQLERELAESERERKIAVQQCWDTEQLASSRHHSAKAVCSRAWIY